MHTFEKPDEVEKYASFIRELGDKCSSTEAIAVETVNYLFNRFGEDGGEHRCALMRFFRTISYSDLTPHLKKRVQEQLSNPKPNPATNCLTLLATRGIEPSWNERLASTGHDVIPLLSDQMVLEAPMIAQLVQKLGIDVSQVVTPEPAVFFSPLEKKYSTMYVPEAVGATAIVSQSNFAIPFKIRSVVGFGGLLATGDMFAVMMFMRVPISANVAERCSALAAAIETSINNLRSSKNKGARILVAVEEPVEERFRQLLGSHHRIVLAQSVDAAKTLLEEHNFDLIVCGTNFDESRMFELITAVKRNKRERTRPVICFSQLSASKSQAAVEKALSALGATCYLQENKMTDEELSSVLQAYLPKEIWNAH
jgi:CheY-like chemotaxis protein